VAAAVPLTEFGPSEWLYFFAVGAAAYGIGWAATRGVSRVRDGFRADSE
jgi:hypothetical protein